MANHVGLQATTIWSTFDRKQRKRISN